MALPHKNINWCGGNKKNEKGKKNTQTKRGKLLLFLLLNDNNNLASITQQITITVCWVEVSED